MTGSCSRGYPPDEEPCRGQPRGSVGSVVAFIRQVVSAQDQFSQGDVFERDLARRLRMELLASGAFHVR